MKSWIKRHLLKCNSAARCKLTECSNPKESFTTCINWVFFLKSLVTDYPNHPWRSSRTLQALLAILCVEQLLPLLNFASGPYYWICIFVLEFWSTSKQQRACCWMEAEKKKVLGGLVFFPHCLKLKHFICNS